MRRRVAIARLLLQQLHDDRFERRRDRRAARTWRLGVVEQMLRDQLARRDAGERRHTDDHLVEDAAERIQIGAMIDRARSARLLGSHVARRAEQRAVDRLREAVALIGELGDAEVEQLRPIAGEHEHVVGLEIAVVDAFGVRGGERACDAEPDRARFGLAQRAARDPRLQRFAVEQLHCQERAAVVGVAEVEHLDDAGMADRADRACFGEEAADRVGTRRQVGAQDFHRGGTREQLVLRAIDRAHAAGAQLFGDPVTTEHLTDEAHRRP